nr:MAG TPA: hypothetical protein [Caudoviricetes sp.]
MNNIEAVSNVRFLCINKIKCYQIDSLKFIPRLVSK